MDKQHSHGIPYAKAAEGTEPYTGDRGAFLSGFGAARWGPCSPVRGQSGTSQLLAQGPRGSRTYSENTVLCKCLGSESESSRRT